MDEPCRCDSPPHPCFVSADIMIQPTNDDRQDLTPVPATAATELVLFGKVSNGSVILESGAELIQEPRRRTRSGSRCHAFPSFSSGSPSIIGPARAAFRAPRAGPG